MAVLHQLKNQHHFFQNRHFLLGLTLVISAMLIITASILFTPIRTLLHQSAGLIGLGQSNITKTETLPSTIFNDVSSNHKNATAINYLKKTHIIQGYKDGFFKPESHITRGELLKVIVTAINAKPTLFTNSNCFQDVHAEWSSPSICFAKTKGWTEGYSDKTFHPDDNIKKAEALKIIMAAFKIKTDNNNVNFSDVKSDQWYAAYIGTAQKAGLLEENPKTEQYNPTNEITRAEVAETLYRAIQKYLPTL